jgi:hypothetical protein
MVQYLSAIALALFFLAYLPWTSLSAFWPAMQAISPALLWVYYFTLVLGLVFPIFYAIGEEDLAWYCLGLAIAVNSIIWAAVEATQTLAAAMTLVVGFLFFIGPLLQKSVKKWDLVKYLLHMFKGFFIVLAVALYSNWVLDDFIGYTSYNHIMPEFLYMGGGLTVVFAVILFVYGLLNILSMLTGSRAGGFLNKLARMFYLLMVLVFLLGITYNVTGYIPYAAIIDPWNGVPFPTSIEFFRGLYLLGTSNLGAILLIMLYIYGMNKIVEKQTQ